MERFFEIVLYDLVYAFDIRDGLFKYSSQNLIFAGCHKYFVFIQLSIPILIHLPNHFPNSLFQLIFIIFVDDILF